MKPVEHQQLPRSAHNLMMTIVRVNFFTHASSMRLRIQLRPSNHKYVATTRWEMGLSLLPFLPTTSRGIVSGLTESSIRKLSEPARPTTAESDKSSGQFDRSSQPSHAQEAHLSPSQLSWQNARS